MKEKSQERVVKMWKKRDSSSLLQECRMIQWKSVWMVFKNNYKPNMDLPYALQYHSWAYRQGTLGCNSDVPVHYYAVHNRQGITSFNAHQQTNGERREMGRSEIIVLRGVT